jgi:hypothetical protein
MLAGLFFFVGSLHGYLKDWQPVWLIFALIGALLIILFASLLSRSEVSLANGMLAGPAGPWPRVLFKRHVMSVAEIVATGVTRSGYTYYERKDGRRVYVSNGYPDSGEFNEAIRAARNSGC